MVLKQISFTTILVKTFEGRFFFFTPSMYCTVLYKQPFFLRQNGTFNSTVEYISNALKEKSHPPKALRRSPLQENYFKTTFTYLEVARNQ